MLKHKEQSIKSKKIAKQFQGIPLIAGAKVHTNRETFKGGKNYSKGRQHSRNPSNSESNLRSIGKSNVTCYYCGHKGHIKSECRTKQHATNAKPKVQSHDHQAKVHASLGTEVLFMQSLSADRQSSKDTLNEKMNTRWYLDSGASDHMAKNREHFVDYVSMETHDIQMGDNLPIQAVGIGKIYTVIPSNGSFAKMELRKVLHIPRLRKNVLHIPRLRKNVLHIPRLRKNLVSWLCLHRNGWGMSHPEEDEMLLSNSKQEDSFKVITKNEQLPYIPLEVHCPLLCNFMQVGGGSDLLELHQVLGHISLDRITQYTAATGIKVPQGITLPTCHACVRGKQPRVPVSIVWMVLTDETLWMRDADLLLEISIEKSCIHVHLMNHKIMDNSKSKKGMQVVLVHNGAKVSL